jgi:replicative DNA helicase
MNQLDLDYFEYIFTYKCLTDETYLSSVADHVKPSFFKSKDIRVIFDIISEFYNTRSVPPTLTEIKTYLTTDELKKSFKDVVSQFAGMDKNLCKEELYANTEKFLKEKAVYVTLMEVVESMGRDQYTTADIHHKFEKACNIALNIDLGIDLLPQIDKVIKDINTDTPCISTPWKWLDNKLAGGFLQNGRALYIFAGETNVGKSIFLGNIATTIANKGKTVVIVTLEMSEMMYARRICSNITRIPVNSMRRESPALKHQINEYTTSTAGAKIIIKEFPPSSISVNQLKGYIKKLISRGIKPDALVIDYANLFASSVGSNSYERIKHITEQLRALSYTFECPVISATQLNRSGYNVNDPGLDTISESMGLAATADVIMGIWQDDTDRDLGVIKLGMMKNRFGQNFGSRSLRIDYPTLTITEDEHINDTESSTSSINTLANLALDN